jgi:hypothetical protein
VRNDVIEAREHSMEPLGVDLLAAGSYARGDQSTLATALQQLDLARMEIVIYHRALSEAVIDRRS